MLRLEQKVKTLLGRNGTAVHVGDVFIMQNYLVLLCKITVCGAPEERTDGSAGSSITQGSITLITLIRALPSPGDVELLLTALGYPSARTLPAPHPKGNIWDFPPWI